MFPQFVFLSNPPSQYQQTVHQFMNKHRFQLHLKQKYRQQLLRFDSDEKFIDSPLTEESLLKITHIKKQLLKYQKIDTVVVAPERKSLRTCYQLFKDQKQAENHSENDKLHIYIQPMLADRLNSTHAIGNLSQQKHKEEYGQFKNIFENFKIMQKSKWIYDILPGRIIHNLASDTQLTSGESYLNVMKANVNLGVKNSLQSKDQFSERIKTLKQSLLKYHNARGTGKNVLIIGSSDVLNFVASTDFHQDGDPVNPLKMGCGQIDLVNVVVNGQKLSSQFDSLFTVPFCG